MTDRKSKAKIPLFSLSRDTSSASSNLSQNRKKSFHKREKICVIDQKAFARDFSSERKARLRTLFKCTFVNGSPQERFPYTPDGSSSVTWAGKYPVCSRRAPVLLHPTLYRVLKLTFPTDVGRIVRRGLW